MALFVGLGIWWGLPLLVAVLLVALLVFGLPLPLTVEASEPVAGGTPRRPARPSRFWVFAAFAILYGVVETMNGNWATLYMTADVGTSATVASLALTAFWGMVTVGRVLFAADRAVVAGAAHLPPAAVRRRRRPGRESPCCPPARPPSACWPSDWSAWAARRSCP